MSVSSSALNVNHFKGRIAFTRNEAKLSSYPLMGPLFGATPGDLSLRLKNIIQERRPGRGFSYREILGNRHGMRKAKKYCSAKMAYKVQKSVDLCYEESRVNHDPFWLKRDGRDMSRAVNLIACGIFQEEAEHILKEAGRPEVETRWLEVGLHDNLELLESSLDEALKTPRPDQAAKPSGIMFGWGCLPWMRDFARERNLPVLPAKNCLAALVGDQELKELEKRIYKNLRIIKIILISVSYPEIQAKFFCHQGIYTTKILLLPVMNCGRKWRGLGGFSFGRAAIVLKVVGVFIFSALDMKSTPSPFS
jgi:hypothetical protein